LFFIQNKQVIILFNKGTKTMKKLLLGSAVAVALLTGCGDEKKESTQTSSAVQEIKKDEVTPVVKEEQSTPAVQDATQAVEKVSNEVKESTEKVVEAVKDVASKVEESTEKIEEPKDTTTTITETKENIVIAPEKVEAEIKEVTEETATTDVPVIDATTLFATCASCHGQKAEKSALGKSQVIAGWDKQKIIDALNGYKNGTYGGVMKNIMTGQVSNKSDAEIEALADLISKM
jgi:cytochrome c553